MVVSAQPVAPSLGTVLAMGCGIDLHPDVFQTGQCVRTNFAMVPLFIVAVGDNQFDLYLDRSFTHYLVDWCNDAGDDSITYT